MRAESEKESKKTQGRGKETKRAIEGMLSETQPVHSVQHSLELTCDASSENSAQIVFVIAAIVWILVWMYVAIKSGLITW